MSVKDDNLGVLDAITIWVSISMPRLFSILHAALSVHVSLSHAREVA